MSERNTPVVAPLVEIDPESPWFGIPVVLLDGTHSYDCDSAGGCG
ncbi:MAG TPA: hypothetical protein VGJ95_03390 [Pseudonocardiaceae bacterium]